MQSDNSSFQFSFMQWSIEKSKMCIRDRTYENGELLEAATRGDGDEGEIITHNTRAISGIPSHITYKERLVVTGEGFIRPSDFEELKTSLQDSSGKPYKNGRNLAAGSIRLMDAKTCQERRLVFMPFGVLEGFPQDVYKRQGEFGTTARRRR